MSNKNELLQKYLDLVRYAPRLRFGSSQCEWIGSSRYEVEKLYPEETRKLASSEGVWNDGFNNGMLAALRLISGGHVTQQSLDKFPDLNRSASETETVHPEENK